MDLLKRPSTDFAAVRDGRQSMPLYIDVDLTTARSISGNNPLILNIAGNSFYTDADTTNGGNAIVHFQDTNLGSASAPFFVSPGFIANVGFTQLLIENTAQAGKRMRIFYGVDIDFQAGVNASITIAGAVSITGGTQPRVEEYTTAFNTTAAFVANTAVQALSPAANTSGFILQNANLGFTGGTGIFGTLIAKTSAPVSISDGDIILAAQNVTAIQLNTLQKEIKVPAGKGLYFIVNGTTSGQLASIIGKLL